MPDRCTYMLDTSNTMNSTNTHLDSTSHNMDGCRNRDHRDDRYHEIVIRN